MDCDSCYSPEQAVHSLSSLLTLVALQFFILSNFQLFLEAVFSLYLCTQSAL